MIWDRTSSGNQSRRRKARPGVSAAALEILEARSLLSAVVVQLSASQDNTIYDMSAGDQSNGRGAFIVAGGDYGSVEARRGLLAFDIASANIPDGSTIIDVVLTMNLSQTMGGAAAVGVHRLLQTWGEGTSNASGNELVGADGSAGDATWLFSRFDSLAWETPGGDFRSASASVQAHQLGAYEWSSSQMVDDVQDWLDESSTNFGWMLKSSELAGNIKAFVSRESGNAALRPRLEITYEEPLVPGIVEGRKWYDRNANGVRESETMLRLKLQFAVGTSLYNSYGGKEYWYQAAGTKDWYFLTPNGALTKWSGKAGQLTGTVVERLDSRVWYNPETLLGTSDVVAEPWMNGFSFELVNASGQVVGSAVSRDMDRNGDGVIQAEAERGWYRFENVAPGSYTVREVLPKGWLQSASATSPGATEAYRLDVSLGLTLSGGLRESYGGGQERWLKGTAGWYYITQMGELYRWNGKSVTTSSPLVGTWIATPGISYYRDMSLLHSAKNPVLAVKPGAVITRVDFGNFKPTLVTAQTSSTQIPAWLRSSRQFLASLANSTTGSGSFWQMVVVITPGGRTIPVDGVRDPLGTTDVWEQTTGGSLNSTGSSTTQTVNRSASAAASAAASKPTVAASSLPSLLDSLFSRPNAF